MAKTGAYNGQKRVEAEQSSYYYREHKVAFGQKREKVGAGQSDTANHTLRLYRFWPLPLKNLPTGLNKKKAAKWFGS